MFEPLLRKASMTSASGTGRAARLLYIEDTLSNLEMVKLAIDSLRPTWQLLAAVDGHSGLRQAREERPALVLLNVHLPGMSADAVLASLRRQPETSRTPVVMVSGDAAQQTRERLLALGANDFLPKPFRVNVLVDKLDHLLQIGCGVPTHRATNNSP